MIFRYDTIRGAIFTCARKPTRLSLIYTTRKRPIHTPQNWGFGRILPPKLVGGVVSGVYRMNEVNPCWTWLVLGWITVFGNNCQRTERCSQTRNGEFVTQNNEF